MNKIKFLFLIICIFFVMGANYIQAKVFPTNLELSSVVNSTTTQVAKEKITTCTKQGITLAIESLKNLQTIVYNFYSTKVAPKTDFWVRDLATRLKAGVLSTVTEKINNWFNNLQEKFLNQSKTSQACPSGRQAGYWQNDTHGLI